MANNCEKALLDAGFDKNDVQLVDKLTKDGVPDNEIVEQLKGEIDKTIFRTSQNRISQERTESFLSSLEEIVNSKSPFKAFFNLLVGDKSGVTSKTLARSQSRSAYVSSLLKLPNHQIKKLLNVDRKFRDDFIAELFDYTPKRKTDNPLAHELATAVVKMQELQVNRMNLYGGGVLLRNDYVTKQFHDPYRMLKATKMKWVQDILLRLDEDKTKAQILYDLKQRGIKVNEKKFNMRGYLNKAYDVLTTKESKDGLVLDSLRVKRTLAFKNSDALIDYNARYGHTNLANAVFDNMNMIDNHISFGEAFGYGYKRNIEPNKILKEKAEEKLFEARKSGDPEKIAEAEEYLESLSKEVISPVTKMKEAIHWLKENKKISKHQARLLRGGLAQVSGDAYMVSNPTVSKFVTGFQFVQMLSKLGKATLSSLSDLWVGSIILHYQGVRPGTAYLGMTTHILRKAFKQVGDNERNQLLRQLNVGVDGIFESYSRNFINNPTMGILNEMTDKMFDWNLLSWWTNSAREGAAKMMSMHIANNLKFKFDELPSKFKKLIQEYNFNAKDWEELRKIGAFDETEFNPKGSKKNKFITSDWIAENGGSVRLQENLNRYYTMESRLAVPEAGAAERAWMYGDSKRGSLPDTVGRLFWQFRTHQLKLIRNLLPRMAEMGIPSLMHVVPAIGLGYVSISLKKMVQGKEPPAYDDPKTLEEALVQSGFLGMVGDFLGGQYANYNDDFSEKVLGNAYRTIKDFSELSYGLSTGNKDASDGWNFLRSNIPYANLFYTEAAFNYAFHYGIMETFSPGYLKRMEARNEGQDSSFFYEPSNIWLTGGFR